MMRKTIKISAIKSTFSILVMVISSQAFAIPSLQKPETFSAAPQFSDKADPNAPFMSNNDSIGIISNIYSLFRKKLPSFNPIDVTRSDYPQLYRVTLEDGSAIYVDKGLTFIISEKSKKKISVDSIR